MPLLLFALTLPLFALPLFAQVDAGSAIWGGIATLLITKFFDWLMLREQNRQLTEKIGNVEAKVDGHATEIKSEAATARRLANTAAEVSITSDQKLDQAVGKLDVIDQQTNGRLEAKERELAAVQAKYEALLAAMPPVPLTPIAEQVAHIAEVIDKADGSGVFKPREPRRRDDPK